MKQIVNFADMVGQGRVIDLLKGEGKEPRHFLLTGPAGTGKTTLSICLSNYLGYPLVRLGAGPLLTPKRVVSELMGLDITGYASNGLIANPKIAKRFIIAIDEVDRLQDTTQWYTVLQDRYIAQDALGKVSWIPYCTIMATTNYPNRLPKAFRDRFVELRVDTYETGELSQMVTREYPKIGKVEAAKIAQCARGRARLALSYADTVERHGFCALYSAYGLDADGLTEIDRRYLAALARVGKPASLATISSMIQEDATVVKTEIEPELLRTGRISIESNGRVLLGTAVRGGRGLCGEFEAV